MGHLLISRTKFKFKVIFIQQNEYSNPGVCYGINLMKIGERRRVMVLYTISRSMYAVAEPLIEAEVAGTRSRPGLSSTL